MGGILYNKILARILHIVSSTGGFLGGGQTFTDVSILLFKSEGGFFSGVGGDDNKIKLF